MAYDTTLKTDPSPMPLKPAILILLHKRRKMAFVAYTTNARGRAAVLTSMIRHRPAEEGNGAKPPKTGKKKEYRNHLRDLPEGSVKDFALLATNIGLEARKANDMVEKLQKKFERDGFTLFGGTRSALPS